MKAYRTDIDGLRAIAVVSVILFHLGYLLNGYLGVDIFFVISGYLITGIVFKEVLENKFSILKFYERRIRRIIPLLLFTTLIALLIGVLTMLPDDLENLCQSVIASNFSANNILMKITSADYWAVKNDYKPLMHTWSLGIEEQFYLLYPFIFFFLKGGRKNLIPVFLIVLTVVSLMYFFLSKDASSKFYFLQYRFFELSIGGLSAIYFQKNQKIKNHHVSPFALVVALLVLVSILTMDWAKSNDLKIFTTVIITTFVLFFGNFHFNDNKNIYKYFISNELLVGIGKISYSLYMWHQIVFAFSRYFLFTEISTSIAIILTALVFLLSILHIILLKTLLGIGNLLNSIFYC